MLQVQCVLAPATANQTGSSAGAEARAVDLTAPLTIAGGQTSASTTSFAAGAPLQAGDYLAITSAQSGGTPAGNVFIELLLQ